MTPILHSRPHQLPLFGDPSTADCTTPLNPWGFLGYYSNPQWWTSEDHQNRDDMANLISQSQPWDFSQCRWLEIQLELDAGEAFPQDWLGYALKTCPRFAEDYWQRR